MSGNTKRKGNTMKDKSKKVSGMLAALVMSFIATSAFAATIDYGGVTWTWESSSYGSGTARAYLKSVSAATDASNIPWTFTVNDTTYTVTEIGGFSGKITGTLNLPESVVYLHGSVFKDCTELTGDISNLTNLTSLGKELFMNTAVYGDVRLPSSVEYIGADAFNGSKITKVEIPNGVPEIRQCAFCNTLITNAVIPRSVTTIGSYAFSNTLVKAVLIPGPATVAPGESQPLTTIKVGAQFAGCPNLKTIVLGPNTTTDKTVWGSNRMARFCNGITGFVPAERNIKDFVVLENASNKVYEYGPGMELDLDIDVDNKLITATPTTENMFTNILVQAVLFKSEFGMDTRINITNDFELSEASISKAMLSGAFFNHLSFSANTQAQFDAILARIRPDIPLVIDISDATEPITIPENRFVAIRANGGWTFKKRNGLVIIFR